MKYAAVQTKKVLLALLEKGSKNPSDGIASLQQAMFHWRNISYLTRMRCVVNSGMCAVCEPHLFVPLVKLWAGSSYVTEASVRLSLNPINQHLWQNQTIWQYQSLKFRIFRTHIVLCHPFQAQKPAHSGAQWVPLLCLVEALFQNWSLTKVCVVPR